MLTAARIPRARIASLLARRLGELLVIAMLCGAVYSDLARFSGPVFERFIPGIVQPGGIDFAAPYLATRVFLRGANPYRHEIAELKDPLGRDHDLFNGRRYDFVYGPAHLLFYTPLALLTDGKRDLGHRVWFHLNLLWCLGLAALTLAVAYALREREAVPLGTAAVVAAALALAPSQSMLLERGQSDLFVALLTWGAVWLALRGRWDVAICLALLSVMTKPYAAPLLGGLFLFALFERALRAAAVGLAAGAVFLLPVWHLIPISLQAAFDRSQYFADHWTSNSFLRVFQWLHLPQPELWRWLAMATGVVVCGALAWRYLGATRDPSPASLAWRRRLVVYFATASLAFTLGASNASVLYNLVLLLPGLLALPLSEPPPASSSTPRDWLGWALLAFAGLVMFWDLPHEADPFPTPALGFLAVFGFAGLKALERVARSSAAPNAVHAGA